MENKTKMFSVLVLMLVSLLAVSAIASALPAEITEVKIDGTEITDGMKLNIVRGQDIEVKVEVNSGDEEICVDEEGNLCNVQIEARIRGYDHDNLIGDITDVFEMRTSNTIYPRTLRLTIPERIDIDPDAEYTLVIEAISSKGVFDSLTKNINLVISADRHLLDIKDIVLSPEREVKAGRALLSSVRIKNYGQKDEDGIKVKVSIPDLGVSASDYIDTIEADESTTSEELYLRIPECAEPGNYRVDVVVEYDDGDEAISEKTSITVVEGDTCSPISGPISVTPETVISVGADSQDVVRGQGGAVYPITITNSGRTARAYTVSTDGAGWATITMSPSSTVLLQPGEAGSVFVYVSAKSDAAVGQQMFVATVSSAGEVIKQVPLKANVLAGGATSTIGIKKALEYGLIVLVILLVILGLIIGFNKLRAEPEEEDRTYY